ncbi:MAG: class I SAM-dependent methyltransferase [Steroidobacteraceae bacterium]
MKQTPCPAARIITGAEYVRQITALESDRRARSAFQDLVVRIAPPGAALFDFGSGAGMDARFYAEHGFTVAAYDVDLQMCEYLAGQCQDLIDAGRVTLERGGYREFLARPCAAGTPGAALVTSNFAPFNLIGDLRELFAKLHALTAPDGRVLASVLSPYFIGDLHYGWWWRNALRLWRNGHYSVPGAQAPIIRRRLAEFAALSAPYFTLHCVFPGLPSNRAQHASGIDVSRGARHAWLRLTRCRFMFLLFERQPQRDDEARKPVFAPSSI